MADGRGIPEDPMLRFRLGSTFSTLWSLTGYHSWLPLPAWAFISISAGWGWWWHPRAPGLGMPVGQLPLSVAIHTTLERRGLW